MLVAVTEVAIAQAEMVALAVAQAEITPRLLVAQAIPHLFLRLKEQTESQNLVALDMAVLVAAAQVKQEGYPRQALEAMAQHLQFQAAALLTLAAAAAETLAATMAALGAEAVAELLLAPRMALLAQPIPEAVAAVVVMVDCRQTLLAAQAVPASS